MLGLAASSRPLNHAQERLSPQSDDCHHLYLSQLRQQNSALVFTNQKHRKLSLPLKELFVPPTLFKRAARPEANGGLFTRISQVWKRTKASEEEPIAQECDWSELFRERAIALIGEAGSGKSCLLRYVALRLSEITLENARAQLSELGLPISSDIPFPLLLRLDQLPSSFRESKFTPEQLWQAFASLYPELPADFFSQQLGQGPNLLLIDGVEQLSQTAFTSLIQLFERFLRQNPHTNIIVSARSTCASDKLALLDRFVEIKLSPFSKAQQRDFISNWSRFFHTRLRLPQAEQLAFEWSERSWQQIHESQAAQQLAERPALLGCLVMLSQQSSCLPKTRKQLYSACCDLLLLQMGDASLFQAKRDLLEQIAYQLQLDQGLSLADLRAQLSHDEQEALADLVQPSGLLEIVEDQQLAFCIQPFQPFLAANYIVKADEQLVAELVDQSADPAWHDCISFCCELLAQPEALALLKRINQQHSSLEEQLEDLTVSSSIVTRSDDREHMAALQDYLRQQAYTLWQEQQEHPIVPQRCGELFGILGDPRSGVCELPPAMVALPSARFTLGYSESELEQFNPQESFLLEDTNNKHVVDIKAFEMARYPISNAQFQAFIDDNGYAQRAWWDFGEISALQAHRELQGIANQAVTNLTWYEAHAFCQWLTAYLDDGYSYSLPSEIEWEYAARGLERRHFAWGNDLQAKAQQQDLSLQALGCYLRDYTPTGIADLGAQIIEWTRSSYADYPYEAFDGRESSQKRPEEEVVCRGRIPWRLNHKPYAAYRYAISAKTYDAWLGFRVIRRPKA